MTTRTTKTLIGTVLALAAGASTAGAASLRTPPIQPGSGRNAPAMRAAAAAGARIPSRPARASGVEEDANARAQAARGCDRSHVLAPQRGRLGRRRAPGPGRHGGVARRRRTGEPAHAAA